MLITAWDEIYAALENPASSFVIQFLGREPAVKFTAPFSCVFLASMPRGFALLGEDQESSQGPLLRTPFITFPEKGPPTPTRLLSDTAEKGKWLCIFVKPPPAQEHF